MKIDKKIMDFFETAYLWLLDQTGVYVGSIQFVLMLINLFSKKNIQPFNIFLAAFMGMFCLGAYVTQRVNKTLYNVTAEKCRESRSRIALTMMLVAFVIFEAIMEDIRGVTSDACWFCYFYLDTVRVREREPPERWFTMPEGAR